MCVYKHIYVCMYIFVCTFSQGLGLSHQRLRAQEQNRPGPKSTSFGFMVKLRDWVP